MRSGKGTPRPELLRSRGLITHINEFRAVQATSTYYRGCGARESVIGNF